MLLAMIPRLSRTGKFFSFQLLPQFLYTGLFNVFMHSSAGPGFKGSLVCCVTGIYFSVLDQDCGLVLSLVSSQNISPAILTSKDLGLFSCNLGLSEVL